MTTARRTTAARPDTWMPLYCGDYLRDTGHLSAAEHGAYFLLLVHYWTTGAPLADNDDELRRISRMERAEWRVSGRRIRRFFQAEGGVLRHKRVDAELAMAIGKVEKRSKAGSKAAAARWQSQCESHEQSHNNGIAEASAKTWQTDAPSPSPSDATLAQQDSLVAAGDAACRAALIDPARLANDFAVVGRWLARFDLDRDILPAIRAVAVRPGYQPPNSLAYFTNPIAEHHAARTSPVPLRPGNQAPPPAPPPRRGIAIGSPEDLAERRAMGLLE